MGYNHSHAFKKIDLGFWNKNGEYEENEIMIKDESCLDINVDCAICNNRYCIVPLEEKYKNVVENYKELLQTYKDCEKEYKKMLVYSHSKK